MLLGCSLLRQALLFLGARLLRDPLKFLRTRGFSQALPGRGLLRDALHLLGFLGQPRFGLGSACQLLPGCALLGKTLPLRGFGGLGQTLALLGRTSKLLFGRSFLRDAQLFLGCDLLGQALSLLGCLRQTLLLFRLRFPGQRLLNLRRGLQRIQRSAVG